MTVHDRADETYRTLSYSQDELEHCYGNNIHILTDPVSLLQLADLCQAHTIQPAINNLVRELYQFLTRKVVCREFALEEISIKTRMAAISEHGTWTGRVTKKHTKTVTVNVMRAVSDYAASVRTALQEGVDALVVGAGLPLDLPELAQDHPDTALVPILSDARGVALLWKKWERRQRLPSALVIEHPAHAAGHLGAARVADLGDPRFAFETVLPAVRQHLRDAGVEGRVPLIAAGGVRTCEDLQRLQSLFGPKNFFLELQVHFEREEEAGRRRFYVPIKQVP